MSTLEIEFCEEVFGGAVPKNYFPDDNPDLRPVMRWRGSAHIVFANWLNYCVYQNTPFNINDINK